MADQKRVLITGAAGNVGRALRRHLRDRYRLRLLDVVPVEGEEDVVVADIQRFEEIVPAMTGVEAVVHLAAIPTEAEFERLLPINIAGTYNVFEAARQCGVGKIVFASTNHVTGYYEVEGVYTTPDMPVRPDSLYGVSKAFGEALGRYFADRYGLSVICFRIGSFIEENRPYGVRSLSTWMSHRDFAQLVWRAIETDVKFGIFYGISGNTRRYWDISNAQAILGYQPEDDAERFAEEIERGSR